MFEDSTFESASRIHTRSRQWMIAAFTFNTSILLAFIVIPLICPPMLPRQVSAFLMEAFVPPKPQPQQPVQTARPASVRTTDPFQPPRIIPSTIVIPAVPDPPIIPSTSSLTDLYNDLILAFSYRSATLPQSRRRRADGLARRDGRRARLLA